MVEICSGKYLCLIALKRWWFFCSRWLLDRCSGSTYTILMIMFPSLGLELSGAKGLVLTVLIKPDCSFLCDSILGFWINYIVWIREENRVGGKKWSTQFPLPQFTTESSLLIIERGNAHCWSAYSIWGALVLKWIIKSRYSKIIIWLVKEKRPFKAFYLDHSDTYSQFKPKLQKFLFVNWNFDSFSLETSLHATISFYERVAHLHKPALFKL